MRKRYNSPATDVMPMAPVQVIAGWDSQYQSGIDPTPGGEDDFATKGYELGWDEADE